MAAAAPDVTPPVAAVVAAAAPAVVPVTIAPPGTRVELMVFDEVTTKTAKPGDLYMLKLAQPLLIGDHVVIPRGTRAWGVVTMASSNGMTGQSGKLSTKLLRIEYEGEQIAISGTPGSKGGSGSEQVILATLALTPWGLFAKGNNAKLKAGDMVYGYLVDGYPAPPVVVPALATAPVARP